jgi:hypothetical protein
VLPLGRYQFHPPGPRQWRGWFTLVHNQLGRYQFHPPGLRLPDCRKSRTTHRPPANIENRPNAHHAARAAYGFFAGAFLPTSKTVRMQTTPRKRLTAGAFLRTSKTVLMQTTHRGLRNSAPRGMAANIENRPDAHHARVCGVPAELATVSGHELTPAALENERLCTANVVISSVTNTLQPGAAGVSQPWLATRVCK